MPKANARKSEEGTLGDFPGTLVLVGAGKMGGALLEAWLRLAVDPKRVVVVEPHPSADLPRLIKRGVRLNPDISKLGAAAALVLAVKPQVAPEVVPRLRPIVGDSTLVASIMAGRTLRFLESALPGAAIVRSMPNTPAAIGRGITVAVPNGRVTEAQRALADGLLRATGAVEWVADESLLDAVTAVSGSGPAYVFLLAETLARAGEAAGLPGELAARLARATVAGSGELLHRSLVDAAQLRENVTSPGGTTAAALEVLMGPDGLEPLMRKAVMAATERSRKLAE
jgi:pyrroline-5-carboxylate reductase